MSAPPPPQGSRISPISPQVATVFPPTAPSTSVDSRFIYAPWNGHSTRAPQGSPRSIPFHDQCTYAPQEFRISPINTRPVTFAPPTPQTNPYNGRSAYAQSNGNPTYTPQGPPQWDSFNDPSIYAPQGSPHSIPYDDRCSYAPQEYRISPVNARTIALPPHTQQTNPYNGRSAYTQVTGNPTNTPQGPPQLDSFNDPSTYASMNGHSTHASREYWTPLINAQPEAFASPTLQSDQLIGYPSYTPHTLSVSMGVPARMSGLITSNISDSNDSIRSLGIQSHDLSDIQDDYHWGPRFPGLSSAYSGDHPTHPQQQMNGNPQSTPHSERTFKCDQCFRSFGRKVDLENHKMLSHVYRPFKCDQCFGSFERNCDLEKHEREAHPGRPFKCDQCSGSFKRRYDLEKHQSEAHAERPFKCDQCSRSFKRNHHLKNHKRLAHVEKTFKCDQCPRIFQWYRDLIRHQTKHLEGKKHFKCDQCPKIFKNKGDLTRHQQNHFVVEPIRCWNCGKGYSRTDNLTVNSHSYIRKVVAYTFRRDTWSSQAAACLPTQSTEGYCRSMDMMFYPWSCAPSLERPLHLWLAPFHPD